MKHDPIHSETANTLYDFVEKVLRLVEPWEKENEDLEAWFRGVSNRERPLLPGAYWRSGVDNDTEETLAVEFQRRGRAYLDPVPQDDWEWYFLMRHHGLPTRLLDWTANPVTAAYFALRGLDKEDKPGKPDPCVWMMDATALNATTIDEKSSTLIWPGGNFSKYWLWQHCGKGRDKVEFDEEGQERTNELPIAITPGHVAPRIVAQQSVFTVHGTKPIPIQEVSSNAKEPFKHRIARIIIPQVGAQHFREDLCRVGVCESALFPDLTHLAKDLLRECRLTQLFTE